jgi:hypothetical protein
MVQHPEWSSLAAPTMRYRLGFMDNVPVFI